MAKRKRTSDIVRQFRRRTSTLRPHEQYAILYRLCEDYMARIFLGGHSVAYIDHWATSGWPRDAERSVRNSINRKAARR